MAQMHGQEDFGGSIFDEDLRPRNSPTTTPDVGGKRFRFKDDDEIQPDTPPLMLPAGVWSLLSVCTALDNAVLPQGPFGPALHASRVAQAQEEKEELLLPFFVKSSDRKPVGFLRPRVVEALRDDNAHMTKMRSQPCWQVMKVPESGDAWGIAFEDWLNDEGRETRSEHMDRVTRAWKQETRFPEELNGELVSGKITATTPSSLASCTNEMSDRECCDLVGWRNELYPIYGPELSQDDPHYNPLPGANTAFDLERAACSLFGFATYGVHMTAYVKKDNQYLIWVPRRSATKQT